MYRFVGAFRLLWRNGCQKTQSGNTSRKNPWSHCRQGNAFCGRYLYGDLCAYGSSDSCNTSGQRPYYAPRRCRFNQKRLTPPSANWYGKVGTIIFYFSVCLIVFLKAFLPTKIWCLIWYCFRLQPHPCYTLCIVTAKSILQWLRSTTNHLKRQLTLKINKFRQINIELFVKQLYNSYITMTANVQFGVLKGVCYALYKMRKTACGCFRFK